MFFDAVIVAVVLLSAVFAFFRGFIREVLTILGVVGGLVAAYFGGPPLLPMMKNWLGIKEGADPKLYFGVIPDTALADALAYGSVFLVVVIVLSIVSHLLAGWARAIGLGAVDRTLGVAFGIVRGVAVLAIIYLLPYILIDKETRMAWIKESRTLVFVEQTSAWMAGFLPESLRDEKAIDARAAADSMAKATREKLKELELLKGENGETPTPPTPEGALPEGPLTPAPGGAGDGASGYNPDTRQDMKDLIQQQNGYND